MKHGGQHWLPNIFNDFFSNDVFMRNSTTAPAINVLETEKEYKVEVAAAGMCKDDFKISIDNIKKQNFAPEATGENTPKKKRISLKSDDILLICLILVLIKEEKCDTKPADEKCECKGRYLRREFSYTKFQQTLVLPDNADTAKIQAKVKHGVLCIHIPKKNNMPDEKTSRVIAIE